MKTLLTLAALLALTACAENPVSTASRPETVALALYGGYTLAEEGAADIAANPVTPASVTAGLKAADARGSPVVEQLPKAANEVSSIRADVDAGGGSKNLLATSIANLNHWIDQAAPLVKDFIDAVKGAKK